MGFLDLIITPSPFQCLNEMDFLRARAARIGLTDGPSDGKATDFEQPITGLCSVAAPVPCSVAAPVQCSVVDRLSGRALGFVNVPAECADAPALRKLVGKYLRQPLKLSFASGWVFSLHDAPMQRAQEKEFPASDLVSEGRLLVEEDWVAARKAQMQPTDTDAREQVGASKPPPKAPKQRVPKNKPAVKHACAAPKNARECFLASTRESFAADWPGAKVSELTRLQGEAWNNMAGRERERYHLAAAADRERCALHPTHLTHFWQGTRGRSDGPSLAY